MNYSTVAVLSLVSRFRSIFRGPAGAMVCYAMVADGWVDGLMGC